MTNFCKNRNYFIGLSDITRNRVGVGLMVICVGTVIGGITLGVLIQLLHSLGDPNCTIIKILVIITGLRGSLIIVEEYNCTGKPR